MKIGKDNILSVARQMPQGMYLVDEFGTEVLLPNAYVVEGMRIDDKLEVFVYTDSEDRLIATTLDPKIQLHEFAYLKVKQVNDFGAFLDWGLNKDLLVPYSNQARPMEEGKSYIVYLILDPKTERLVGTTRFIKLFKNEEHNLKLDDQVDVLFYDLTDLGANVIINNKYRGLIYKNEIFQSFNIGDCAKAWVKNIRPDNKIDLSLNKPGYSHVLNDAERILEKLNASGGFIGLSDKSKPEDIINRLEMSKKTFKKAIGALYKEKKIILEEDGIRLIKK